MPLYTYRCKECEYQFDIRQSFSEDALIDCEKCGKPALRKVINQVGVVFKGKGFYVNDSKSNNPAAPSGKSKDKDSGSSSSDSSSGKSDSGESTSTSESSAAKSESKPKAAASSDS